MQNRVGSHRLKPDNSDEPSEFYISRSVESYKKMLKTTRTATLPKTHSFRTMKDINSKF